MNNLITRVRETAIYMASKTKHAARWRELRGQGVPVNSTWIDEAGAGESACLTDLWRRCIAEASGAACVIVYREPDDVLKGAFIEVGAALANGVPVFAVGCHGMTFLNHELVTACSSLEVALNLAGARRPIPPVEPSIKCEKCRGRGEVRWRHRFGIGWDYTTCSDCGGSGIAHPHCDSPPEQLEPFAVDAQERGQQ